MRRILIPVLVFALALGGVLFGLSRTYMLLPVAANGTASMAPTIPGCNGHALAEGFTYRSKDPKRGDIVAIHAEGKPGGKVRPSGYARDVTLTKRVVGIPGDTVEGRKGHVFVSGVPADAIKTRNFPRVTLDLNEYFVIGDNRDASKDSRAFGPVRRDAIFGRIVLVLWPLGHFGSLPDRLPGAPPGAMCV